MVAMAHSGAQVLHPKTIKPLQNAGIPLFVKSFLAPEMPGTMIHSAPLSSTSSSVELNNNNNNLPPIIVFKGDLALMRLRSTDLVCYRNFSIWE
jgi:aspartate kinase